jgi:hypothetical protein
MLTATFALANITRCGCIAGHSELEAKILYSRSAKTRASHALSSSSLYKFGIALINCRSAINQVL